MIARVLAFTSALFSLKITLPPLILHAMKASSGLSATVKTLLLALSSGSSPMKRRALSGRGAAESVS